jgi:ribosomal protein S18 acetylase RimI-like enzyme
LVNWGKEYSAKCAYLQVVLENVPALNLYSKMGFKERYQYWYRIKRRKSLGG